MRKRRHIVLLIAVALLAVAAFLLLRGEREPIYQGRKLSQWLQSLPPYFAPSASKEFLQLTNAVAHIGSNALPYLLKWIPCEGSTSHLNEWLAFGLKALPPSVVPGSLRARASPDWKRYRANAALVALRILGPDAEPSLAPLAGLARDHAHPETANRATFGLAAIGPRALPVLLEIIGDTNASSRFAATLCITRIERDGIYPWPEVVDLEYRFDRLRPYPNWFLVEAREDLFAVTRRLMWALKSRNPRVRTAAADFLGDLNGGAAKPALPMLRSALSDEDESVRRAASNALELISSRFPSTNSTR